MTDAKPIHARLSDAFVAVWNRLPDDVRDVLQGNFGWELVADIKPLPDGQATWAECQHSGILLFAADQIGHLDDDLLAALVGHELSHRYLQLVGDPLSADEDRADGLVRDWGFAIDGLRAVASPRTSADTGAAAAAG